MTIGYDANCHTILISDVFLPMSIFKRYRDLYNVKMSAST